MLSDRTLFLVSLVSADLVGFPSDQRVSCLEWHCVHLCTLCLNAYHLGVFRLCPKPVKLSTERLQVDGYATWQQESKAGTTCRSTQGVAQVLDHRAFASRQDKNNQGIRVRKQDNNLLCMSVFLTALL